MICGILFIPFLPIILDQAQLRAPEQIEESKVSALFHWFKLIEAQGFPSSWFSFEANYGNSFLERKT